MRVGLFSPMGTGNLGDASTQDAVIHNLRKRVPGIEIFGFSLNAEDTTLRHGIQGFPVSRIHWERPTAGSTGVSPVRAAFQNNTVVRLLRRILLRVPQEMAFNVQAFRRVRSLDLVIFSGSGQLADEWKKADAHSYSIFRWTLLAKLAGVPVLFISVGAGPLTSPRNRTYITRALSMASYRSFRDAGSREYMAGIGFDRSDPIVPDLAHSIADLDGLRTRRADSDALVVGISPMAYAAPGLWYTEHTEIYQGYIDKLAAFTAWLRENAIDTVFFPSAVPSDTHVIDDVTKLLKEKYHLTVRSDRHPVESVTDLLETIADVDIVVSSRFHGILLPLALHKPVVALSYHPKDASLMKDMGQEQYCLDIETFDVPSLIDRFQKLRTDRAAARRQIAAKEQEYRVLLDAQYDRIIGMASPDRPH